jgi:hypothetical protein
MFVLEFKIFNDFSAYHLQPRIEKPLYLRILERGVTTGFSFNQKWLKATYFKSRGK